MSKLDQLPQELLLDDLLPLISVKDSLSLFQTNRFFAKLGDDEVFWKRRLREDFNYSNASNARSSGFKFLYSRLSAHSKLFVWGGTGEGRMGRKIPTTTRSASTRGKQLWPLELKLPGTRVVELAAGGWSFTALDSKGRIHVWGQLDGAWGLQRDGFTFSSKQASTPAILNLPKPIQTLSCGRNFMTALDHDGDVWCFNSWGIPFQYQPNAFDHSIPDRKIIQVECGWSFVSALTESGTAYVWNVTYGEIKRRYEQMEEALANSPPPDGQPDYRSAPLVDGVIQCQVQRLQGCEPLVLPDLPELPVLDPAITQPKLIKLGAGDHFVVGLTDAGHVLKLNIGDINEPDAISTLTDSFKKGLRAWEFLPNFCQTSSVKALDEFKSQETIRVPDRLKITHISAHFLTFVAYSTGPDSIVLMGPNDATPETKPSVISTLQNKGVISIVIGDYHFGALLENGKLLSWGASTATGLGDPYEIEPGKPGGFATSQHRDRSLEVYQNLPNIEVPTEVTFSHGLKKKRDRFVFAAAAAGWHMGALVVDLDQSDEEEEEPTVDSPPTDDENSASSLGAAHGHIFPPYIIRGSFPIRFGQPFAAARGRGRGYQPPVQPNPDT